MIDTIYIEEDVKEHPRALQISSKFRHARIIEIKRYTELFNKKGQSFRLQKRNPALILAKKSSPCVLPAPDGFGIGGRKNYYFSHMYNCLYDCSYCFLQGMYASADYVIFVNYEDFAKEILEKSKESPLMAKTFFSGYDCDSLAMEGITGFAEHFLPIFEKTSNSELELRTKSVSIEILKNMKPIENCIVAFSLSPDEVAKYLDIKAPRIIRRLEAMSYLSKKGWKVGLRFDPLIYSHNWVEIYTKLFDACFGKIDTSKIHSISFGALRFPKAMYKKIKSDRPADELLIGPLELSDGIVTYKKNIEEEMVRFCEDQLSKRIEKGKLFRCGFN